MNSTSRLSRGAAVVAAAAVLAAGAGTAEAATAHAPAVAASSAHADLNALFRIPFTAATVTPGTAAGTLSVTWTAPHVLGVAVFAGSSAKAQTRLVGVGRATDTVTVTAKYGSWIKLVPAGGRPLVLSVRDLGLASDPNLRDIGGYRTADGQWVRPGVVYRSQALSLSAADLATVDGLGITADYDLRTSAEIAASPDVVPAGAAYVHLDVIGGGSATVPNITSADEAVALMQEGERQFVLSPTAQQAFSQLLTGIADGSGASLYHCTAGKDRTGWATAVILSLLGVDQDTITNDYLLSNTYFFDSPAVQAQLAAMPPATAAVYTPLMQVRTSYLQAGFDQVKASYGSMYDYAVHGLGLSPQTIAKLRARLLVG